AFAQKHGLSNYQVYETTRNGKSWYVLVYGNFPTVGDAKREVERLPAEIQGKKPWVRKMQQVHQDMK
ncbi:SPOR domain-containing protein, partial [Klebsiella pneumoniae]